MSNSNNGGGLAAAMWIVTIILSIVSGVISWNIVDPDSFMEFVGFLLVWGVLSSVGHFLAMGLVAIFNK
jgi:hypothetical protein